MIVTTDTPHFGFLSYVYRSIFRLPPVVFSHPSFVFRLPFSHLSSFVSRLPFRLLSFRCLSSAFYLLPYTFCLLPSTFRLLPSAFCLLHSIFRLSASIFRLFVFCLLVSVFLSFFFHLYFIGNPAFVSWLPSLISQLLSSAFYLSSPSIQPVIFSHLQSSIFSRLPFHLQSSSVGHLSSTISSFGFHLPSFVSRLPFRLPPSYSAVFCRRLSPDYD